MSISVLKFHVSDAPIEEIRQYASSTTTQFTCLSIVNRYSKLEESGLASVLDPTLTALLRHGVADEVWLAAYRLPLAQPDTRIVRYYGFWKSPVFTEFSDWGREVQLILPVQNGIRLAGATTLHPGDGRMIEKFTASVSLSICYIAGRGSMRPAVERLLRLGWPEPAYGFGREFIDVIEQEGAIVARVLCGNPDFGLFCIGHAAPISQLAAAIEGFKDLGTSPISGK
jgi:hypothetical protein